MASSTYSLPVSRPRWEGSSAERAIQPRKWYSSPLEHQLVAPTGGLIPHHLPDAVVQPVRCGAAGDPVVPPQAALVQILSRPGTMKAHPDVGPGLALVRLVGGHLIR